MNALSCACGRYPDGHWDPTLCPLHAETDPCLTIAKRWGVRRKGTIRRGVCSACGHRGA